MISVLYAASFLCVQHSKSVLVTMVLYVAYKGDWTKEIVGVFSTVEKADEATENLNRVHVYEVELNKDMSECHCMRCRAHQIDSNPTKLTPGQPLWVSYYDWDRFNDRPVYTVGIQEVTDHEPKDNTYSHVVSVKLDDPVAEPAECDSCPRCLYYAEENRRNDAYRKEHLEKELKRVQQQLQLVDCA